MGGSKMNLVCFKQGSLYYITDNVDNKGYFSTQIPNLVFNNNLKANKTGKDGVYSLTEYPETAKRKESDKSVFSHYELKEGFPISDLTPKTLNELDEDDDIYGLYKIVYNKIEGNWVDEILEVEYLGEVENITLEKPKYPFSVYLINQISTHPVLLDSAPCFISGKQLYPILRAYIKQHINPQYATITSDYDFCLTVQKVITHEPISQVFYKTVGKGRNKREVADTRYLRERKVICFETSPEGYSKYPTLKGISGLNKKDLEEKIDEFLQSTIEMINEPLIECSHCQGRGVVNV